LAKRLDGVPRRGRPPGSGDERDQPRAFLADFARELHDGAPLSSTITRVLRLFRITQEHSGQITTTAGEGSFAGIKNKMPYFLAVVESLIGLRPAEEAAPEVAPPVPTGRSRGSGQSR
jgi:hypothetical protein